MYWSYNNRRIQTVYRKRWRIRKKISEGLIDPTSISETIEILNNIKERYEEHHNVEYTEDAINSCVVLTDRYMNDRYLPDKAIDALDEAGSRVHITNIKVPKKISSLEEKIEDLVKLKKNAISQQKFEEAAKLRDYKKNSIKELNEAKKQWENEIKSNKIIVNGDNVAEVVSLMTGIPVQRIASKEIKKLSKMSNNIKKKIIGQDDAITKISRAIQRNRVGLKDPKKPIGTFIFLGSTGVGKTQLAKALSEEMFDSTDSLIRIDMSEYMKNSQSQDWLALLLATLDMKKVVN